MDGDLISFANEPSLPQIPHMESENQDDQDALQDPLMHMDALPAMQLQGASNDDTENPSSAEALVEVSGGVDAPHLVESGAVNVVATGDVKESPIYPPQKPLEHAPPCRVCLGAPVHPALCSQCHTMVCQDQCSRVVIPSSLGETAPRRLCCQCIAQITARRSEQDLAKARELQAQFDAEAAQQQAAQTTPSQTPLFFAPPVAPPKSPAQHECRICRGAPKRGQQCTECHTQVCTGAGPWAKGACSRLVTASSLGERVPRRICVQCIADIKRRPEVMQQDDYALALVLQRQYDAEEAGVPVNAEKCPPQQQQPQHQEQQQQQQQQQQSVAAEPAVGVSVFRGFFNKISSRVKVVSDAQLLATASQQLQTTWELPSNVYSMFQENLASDPENALIYDAVNVFCSTFETEESPEQTVMQFIRAVWTRLSALKSWAHFVLIPDASITASLSMTLNEPEALTRETIEDGPFYRGGGVFDLLYECIEKLVLSRLYSKIFVSHIEEDMRLFTRLQSLSFLLPVHWGVDHRDARAWNSASEHLYAINSAKSPLAKLACLRKAIMAISKALSNDPKAVGADSFLPVLIYVLVQTNCPSLASNLKFIRSFRHRRSLSDSENGYFLTAVESSLAHLLEEDLQCGIHLSLEQEQFDVLQAKYLAELAEGKCRPRFFYPPKEDWVLVAEASSEEETPSVGPDKFELERIEFFMKCSVDQVIHDKRQIEELLMRFRTLQRKEASTSNVNNEKETPMSENK